MSAPIPTGMQRVLVTVHLNEDPDPVPSFAERVEAISGPYFVMHCSKDQVGSLKEAGYTVRVIDRIPAKNRIPKEIQNPEDHFYYFTVPGPLLPQWQQQLDELKVRIEDTMTYCDPDRRSYIAFLRAEQVHQVWRLPFVSEVRHEQEDE